MNLSAGTRLGPYEILAPIGAGGMGEVYKARDTRLDRIVALKFSKEKFSERFEREARSIAALNHPHICTLHDVGPDYLVMEYIEGTPLKGPLPLEQAMKYVAQICDALDAAHKKGITHRDLKPANILVTKSGVKLLDFGLARLASSASDDTLTMAVMGTPAYMAPEQWEGKPGDARSDIYALGCVIYEMLTGKRAAKDRAPVEPASVERVVRRCLESDPDERWQTAKDVRHSLEFLEPAGPRVAAAAAWSGWAGWIAAAALLAVAAFLALRGRAPATGDLVRFAVYPPENATFSADSNVTLNVPQFALSPDGRTLAFVANAPGEPPMIWLRLLSQVSAQLIPGTENAKQPFWSPDSRWVGFYADGKVKKVPAAGGTVQVVTGTNADFRGGAWGPDDSILVGTGAEPIYRVNAAGGDSTQVTTLGSAPQTDRYPFFLPDGRHFLYLLENNVPGQTGIYVGSLNDKIKKFVLGSNFSAVYAPVLNKQEGYLLSVDGDKLMAQGFDASRLEAKGRPFLVAEHAGHNTAFYSAVSVSPAGPVAYAPTILQHGQLTWFDRGGTVLGRVGPDGDYSDFRLSPDEGSLAVSLVDGKTGTVDIWMTDLKRTNMSRFSSGRFVSATPIWAPDGSRLVYRSFHTGLVALYRRSAGGGGNEETILSAETQRAAQIRSPNVVPTDWSPDGARVLFSVPTSAAGSDLWLLPLTGDTRPVQFVATPAEELQGNFSPDGRYVAYTSNESGRFEVYVETYPRSDRKWTVSTNGGSEPRWRADGREIYYLSADHKVMAVPIDTGPRFAVPVPLFQTRVQGNVTPFRTHYVPSRDGKRFLVNMASSDPSPVSITVVLNWTAGLRQ